ncbi:hypothetical protein HMPREF9709_00206 [Helcococcus kunzii ATCC 51366]|uniref:Uncharacterized protein n=1 Tax=Helcococcus kunzii ATCC 51366 TaxID=883114 RepID=H3NLJ5_9FIRM|nr:hypothetical protein [Helcococcus kunzii]EHR35847.1 hypothetical protein HMPREF9709_00206 [Helcococcus kunzii ATCC 51366]
MKKNTNNIICILLSIMFVINISTTTFAAGQNNDLKSKYIEVYEQYKKINKSNYSINKPYLSTSNNKNIEKKNYSGLSDDDIEELKKEKIEPELYEFFAFFKKANFLDLYSNIKEKIVLKEDLNIPVLISIENDNEILIQIGLNKYIIKSEISEFSKKIVVFLGDKKAILLNEECYEDKTAEDIKGYLKNNDGMLASKAYWMNETRTYKGETGFWLIVLTVIADAAGYIISFMFKDPVLKERLGTILQITGTALTVGALVYRKFYVIKYQARRSDCKTYIRERSVFYQYSNYTGKVKESTYKFHSQRPDYAGGACTMYY